MASNSRKSNVSTSSDIFIDNKTWKAILHETCVKRKIRSPSYNHDTVVPASTSTQLFRCVCTVPRGDDLDDIKGEGLASTKKEAEQRAAMIVLPELVGYKDLFEFTSAGQAMKSAMLEQQKAIEALDQQQRLDIDSDPVSDTDDDKAGQNSVGDLNTLCQRNKLALPEWKESERKGPKVAIFTANCSVGCIAKGVGRRMTKKDARRIAAHRVLNVLRDKGYENEKKKGKTSNPQPSTAKSEKDEVSSSECSEFVAGDDVAESDREEISRPSGLVLAEKTHCLSTNIEPAKRASRSHLDDGQDKSDDDMEIASNTLSTINLKRKLSALNESEPDIKRKHEQLILHQLTCARQNENCLKFIKDLSHIFLHLQVSTAVENQLVSQDDLREPEDALRLLKDVTDELGLKFSFSKTIPLKPRGAPGTNSETNAQSPKCCVFLKLQLPQEYRFNFQKVHSLYGYGSSFTECQQKACLLALEYIRQMKISNSEM